MFISAKTKTRKINITANYEIYTITFNKNKFVDNYSKLHEYSTYSNLMSISKKYAHAICIPVSKQQKICSFHKCNTRLFWVKVPSAIFGGMKFYLTSKYNWNIYWNCSCTSVLIISLYVFFSINAVEYDTKY